MIKVVGGQSSLPAFGVPGEPFALFDADNIVGITNGALLDTWYNEGVDGGSVNDSGVGSRTPTYYTSGGPEGGARVYFKNKLLDGTTSAHTQPIVAACVFQTDAVDRGTYDPFQRGLNTYECYIQRSSGNLIAGAQNGFELTLTGGDPGAGVWGWFVATFNGANSRIVDDRGNVQTGNAGTNGIPTGVAFGRNVSGSRFLDGSVAMWGYWDDGTSEADIVRYLTKRYPSIQMLINEQSCDMSLRNPNVLRDYKASVRLATTANITLSGHQSIDGSTTEDGYRVLVKDQTLSSENGIYVAASGAWSRSKDADQDAELTPGTLVPVEYGTDNAITLWMVSAVNDITIGVTDFTFEQVGGLGGSGTAEKLAYWSTSTSLTADTLLHWDNSNNRFGVGTAGPDTLVHIQGTGPTEQTLTVNSGGGSNNDRIISLRTTAAGGAERLSLGVNVTNSQGVVTGTSDLLFITDRDGNETAADWIFGTDGDSAAYTEAARITDEGRLSLNSGTPVAALHITPPGTTGLSSPSETQVSTDGYGIRVETYSFNDSTNEVGTNLAFASNTFNAPTLTANLAARTTTDAANVYIDGEVLDSGLMTITNPWALWSNGNIRLDGLLALEETPPPGIPDTGFGYLYAKTDGYLYWKNDANEEFNVASGTGGGGGGLSEPLTLAQTLTTVNVVPTVDGTYSLGTPSLRYKDGYFSEGTIHIGNGTISYNELEDILVLNEGGDVSLPGVLTIDEQLSAPATPDAGVGKLYGKTDGYVYWKNDLGQEFNLYNPGGGGAGAVSSTGTPADNQLAVWTSSSTIEGDANLTWDASQMTILSSAASGVMLELQRTGASGSTSGPAFRLYQNDGTTMTADERLGIMVFQGFDGSTISTAAAIQAFSESTWGSGDSPGYLTFSTTPDASATQLERMRIASDGKVGIGTSTSIRNLQVTSDAVTTMGLSAYNSTAGQRPAFSFVRAGGSASSPTAVANNLILGEINFNGYRDASTERTGGQIIGRADGTWTASNEGTDIEFWNTPNGSTTLTEVVRIDSSGNLRIIQDSVNLSLGAGNDLTLTHNGTNSIIANATGDLQINGVAGAEVVLNESGADVDFRVESDTNTHLLFADAGLNRVGVRVSAPVAALDLSGDFHLGDSRSDNANKTARIAMPQYDIDEEGYQIIGGNATSGANNVNVGGGTGSYNAANFIKFYTAANTTTLTGTERMRIDSDGNVGIGIDSPATTLHVSGDGNVPAAALTSNDVVTISQQNTAPGFAIVSAGANSWERAVFKGTRADGTLASPTAPAVDDQVLSFLGAIYDGNSTEGTAAIDFYVDGAVSDGVAPQRISFVTSATNAAARTERMVIKSNGNVGIADTTPTSTLDVGGSFAAAISEETSTTLDDTNHFVVVDTDAGTQTIFLPAASTCAGRGYYIRNNGTSGNDVAIDADGSETINGSLTHTLSDGQSAHIVCDGTEWFTF